MVNIKIDTLNTHLISDLFEDTNTFKREETKKVTEDYTLLYKGSIMRLGLNYPQTINLTLTILTSVGASLFANWLYDKLKNKNVTSIKINEQEVEIEIEKIKLAIEK